MPSELRLFDRSQPQTLQYGVILLYIDAVFLVIFGVVVLGVGAAASIAIGLALAAAMVAGGLGIANEHKWGYVLGVAAAVVALLYAGYVTFYLVDTGYVLNLVFAIALVALLLHHQSREYLRIWFK